ncbi:hypothetical protein CP532_4982 [Ophiocordyceps camponoti-leonardi (nom. inval.)]|nr:hypothetical protein CP532_4982 [Ophiocordyceps camponoti-leonardi (nom. inval.)]
MSDLKRYIIGWISAIYLESVAVRVFLDEKHNGPISTPKGDENSYTLGRIGRHNVVLASLPAGSNGIVSAVMENDEFRAWKTLLASLLWLHGKVGSGKSILYSSVIQYLQDSHGSDPKTALAYFFFSFSDIGKQEVNGMLASLIKQLCVARPDIPRAVARLGEYKDRGHHPSTNKLEEALLATAYGFTYAYIVIDGLDECPRISGEREKLLDVLDHIITKAPGNLHIFCTSRREPDIATAIDDIFNMFGQSTVEIDLTTKRDMLDKDIVLYVDSTLASRSYKSWPESVKKEARDALLNKADGMFQYIFHQLNVLEKLSSISSVRKALEDLPDGLDETSLLQWLAFSKDRLTLDQLAEIFVLYPERDVVLDIKERLFEAGDVLKYLTSLAVVEGGHIRLVHFSIKEYLISSRIADGPVKQFSFLESSAHLQIVQSCIAYYLYSSSAGTDGRHELDYYAVQYWMHHLELHGKLGIALHIALYDNQPHLVELLIERGARFDVLNEAGSTLTLAIMLEDPTEFLKYLLDNNVDVNTCHVQYGTALSYAAKWGQDAAILRLLLDRGADVNASGGWYGSALQAACYHHRLETIKLLLSKGANINSQNGRYGTPLQAAYRRSRSIECVQYLLQNGADVGILGGLYGSALQALLLNKGADVNASGGCRGTALQIAAGGKDVELVKLLFDHGAKAACWGKNIEAVRLLLQRGANLHSQGGYCGSAWYAAVFPRGDYYDTGRDNRYYDDFGPEATNLLRFLLDTDHETDVNDTRGLRRATAVHAALQTRCFQVPVRQRDRLRFLLRRGANINLAAGEFGFPLQAACAIKANPLNIFENRDRAENVEFLLRTCPSIDVNARGGLFDSALQAAAYSGQKQSAELLLSKGADSNACGGKYGNLLNAAVIRGNWDIVGLLLRHGATPDSHRL